MDFFEVMEKAGLARRRCWTISDKRKRPLNPTTGLRQHWDPEKYQPALAKPNDSYYWGDLCSNPERQLVTLEQLMSEPQTPANAWALRVDTKTQNILLVDIEREYDHKLNPLIRGLPIVYAERSRHGGMHLIVEVDQDFLDDPIYAPIIDKGWYKVAGTSTAHSGIEVFTFGHYLTFTTNQIMVKRKGNIKGLMKFLDYISKHKTIGVVKRLDFTGYALSMDKMLAVSRLAKDGLSDRDLIQIAQTAKLYNNPDFNGDEKHHLGDKSQSRRDYMIVLAVTFKLLYQMASRYRTSNLTQNDEQFFNDANHNKWSPRNDHLKYDPEVISKTIQKISWRYLKKRAKLTQRRTSRQTYHELVVSEALGYALEHTTIGRRVVQQMKGLQYLKGGDLFGD